MSEQARATLRRVFPQLDAEATEELLTLVRVEQYGNGVKLCRQGEEGQTFYIIVSGAVEVYQVGDQGPQLLDRLEAGEFFGEMSLLLNQPRNADVVVAGGAAVVEIDRDTFRRRLQSNSEIVLAMNQLIITRLLNQGTRLLERLPPPPDPDSGPRIFISYASEDLRFVEQLSADLARQGLNVWIDRRQIDPGSSWTREIQKALDQCAVMIVVLSPHSVDSDNVEDEWHYFREENKPIVPVIYQDCQAPFRLRRIQHISFVDMNYENALHHLVIQLHTFLH